MGWPLRIFSHFGCTFVGDRTDLAYDNDALDVLTELFDNDNTELPEELLNQQTKDSPQLSRPQQAVVAQEQKLQNHT